MVREHSNSLLPSGYPPAAAGGPTPPHAQHPYYAYGGSSAPPPGLYPEGAYSGPPPTASAATPVAPLDRDKNATTTPTGPPPHHPEGSLPPISPYHHHHHHHGPPPPSPYGQGPLPSSAASPYRSTLPPTPPAIRNGTTAATNGTIGPSPPPSLRSYPVPDGVGSTPSKNYNNNGSTGTASPGGGLPPLPSQWQSMHLPSHGEPGRLPPPYPAWGSEQAHHHHHHHHAAAAAAAAQAAYYHSPQRGPPPPPHYWRVAPPPSLSHAGSSSSGGLGGVGVGGPQQRHKHSPAAKKQLKALQHAAASQAAASHAAAVAMDPAAAALENRPGATSPSEIETTHKTEVQIMGCTCKKTRCLKLYCQCFGVKLYCGAACRCLSCYNTVGHEKQRQEAMRQILQRNPAAFDTKFQKTAQAQAALPLAHKLGCKCRKSACMKKYCECYAGSVKCSATCRCIGCKNVGPFGGPGDTAGSATGATIRPKAVRRKKSEPFQAAQNLTFLKHGSPEHQKVVQKVVRRTSKMAHDVGSMPSLASSSEGTMSGSPEQQQVARIQSKDTDDEGEGERAADKSNKEKRKGVKPVVPEQDDDVKTLLMAAYAMAEIGGGSSPAKRGNSPPQNGTAGPAAVSETSTPTFKRPRTEATTETALL